MLEKLLLLGLLAAQPSISIEKQESKKLELINLEQAHPTIAKLKKAVEVFQKTTYKIHSLTNFYRQPLTYIDTTARITISGPQKEIEQILTKLLAKGVGN